MLYIHAYTHTYIHTYTGNFLITRWKLISFMTFTVIGAIGVDAGHKANVFLAVMAPLHTLINIYQDKHTCRITVDMVTAFVN